MAEFLEVLMLAAFSVGWYWSIWKMLRTGQAGGKSLGFVFLICLGYFSGILSKVMDGFETGDMSRLVYLYAWNFAVTAFDAWLVISLSRRPRTPTSPFFEMFKRLGFTAKPHSDSESSLPPLDRRKSAAPE